LPRPPLPNRDAALREAAAFLRQQYLPTVRLLREAPKAAPNRYWLLNDNALAALALDALGEGALAYDLQKTLQTYGVVDADGVPSASPLAVLWGKTVDWPPHTIGVRRFSVTPPIDVPLESLCWGPACGVDVVAEHWDGDGTFADWAEYTNLAAIGALNEWNAGRHDEARRIFADLRGKLDGTGFQDKVYSANAGREYETFKLALALYVGLKLGALDGSHAEALARALIAKRHAADGTEQAGGFHTHYVATELRGDVNTETTALAILALHEYGA
jgi:hypothetical protein